MATQEELQRQGQGPSPQRGALALANQRRVERTQSGLYGTPRTQEQIQVDTGLPGYQDRVNAIPGPNDNDLAGMARVNARFKPGVPATQRPTAEQPAVPQPPSQNYDFQPDPMQGPAMGMSVRNTSVDGIRRIDNAPGLNSPLFTNLPTGEAISGMQGGTVNTIPSLTRRPSALGAVQTPQMQEPIGPRGGVIGDGRDPSAERYTSLMREVARLNQGGRAGRNKANVLVSAYQAAQRGETDDRGFVQGQDELALRQGELAFRQEDAAAGRAQTNALEQMRQRSAFGLEDMRQRADQPLRDAQVRELEQRARPQGQAMPRVDGQVLRALLDTDPEQAKTYFADTENQRRAYGVAAQALALAQQDGLTQQQIMSDPRLREAYVTVYGPPRFAGGGLVPDYDSAMGYAQGGMVRGAGYGQTPQAAAVLPEVNEYRDYAMGAKSLGLPAVPFEQFLTLRQGAKQVAAAQPQGGAMAFANGGEVPNPRDVGGRMVMDTDPNAPTDSIPAMVDESMPAKLDSGEFVIPKDVVQFFGTDKLNKLIAQARQGQ